MCCDSMMRRWVPYSSFDYSQEGVRQDLCMLADMITNQQLVRKAWDYYSRHVRNYVELCRRFGLQPFPVSARALILFLSHHLATGHAASTMDQIKCAVKKEQQINPRWSQYPFLPGNEDVLVRAFQRGAKKMFKAGPRRKRPLNIPVLTAMALRADMAKPRDQQYVTMAFVAHDGLLRFSELMALRVRDVVWDHRDRVVYLIVRDAKANKDGPPELVALMSYGELSGAALLEAYWVGRRLQEANPDDYLFPICQEQPGLMDGEIPVCKSNFIKWARRLLEGLGLDGNEFSGHSFRSGGATDMWSRRMPRELIKLAGRWKSEAYAIYCRDHPAENAFAVAWAFQEVYRQTYEFHEV